MRQHRMNDYGVESANQRDRLICGAIGVATAGFLAVMATTLFDADARVNDTPLPTAPVSVEVAVPETNITD